MICVFCGSRFRSRTKYVYCSSVCEERSRLAWSYFRIWENTIRGPGCWECSIPGIKGYPMIKINGHGQYVSHVVWFLTYGEWPTQCVLHHCDNPACIKPTCLFQGTKAENNADRVAKGRGSKGDAHWSRTRPENLRRGEAHGRAKMTEADIREARSLHAAGWSYPRLARRYGVTHPAVRDAVIGKTWAHVR